MLTPTLQRSVPLKQYAAVTPLPHSTCLHARHRRLPSTPLLPALKAAFNCGRQHASVRSTPGGAPRQSISLAVASAAPAPALSAPVPSFLDELSAEQQAAVLSPEQHVRVIAGPGSGKTRTVTARVSWLLQNGVQPHEVLVITFTRKAAEELTTRLQEGLGRVPTGLLACTFHSLCAQLVRRHSPRRHFDVADRDDSLQVIKRIINPESDLNLAMTQAASSRSSTDSTDSSDGPDSTDSNGPPAPAAPTAAATSTADSSATTSPATGHDVGLFAHERGEEDESLSHKARYFQERIGAMKNFVEQIHSHESTPKRGLDILQELSGAPEFVSLTESRLRQLAYVYDTYNRTLRRERLMDFDDLLHNALDVVSSRPEVLQSLHSRWRHVLVDEGQDTNLCQFRLVRSITGPEACLFMVGDPDQAIYGFRGARAGLLQETFTSVYRGTCATRRLSDNYRSRPPIVMVADMIRRHLRPSLDGFVPGRSTKDSGGASPAVMLLKARDEFDEARQIVDHLREWQRQGYAWSQMAVLCRGKQPLRQAYFVAVQAGIPAMLAAGDLWDSLEAKVALALLRCVVAPEAAGDAMLRRLIKAGRVKVPVTAGLGETPIKALQEAVASHWFANDGTSSSTRTPPATLGACLLQGCGLGSMDEQQAAAILQAWDDANMSGSQEALDAALESLAPPWQQLPGLRALNKRQRAGLVRLRGVVQLATAAAMSKPPHSVLELLLSASGVMGSLEAEAAAGKAGRRANDRDDAGAAKRRLDNLQVLLQIACRAADLSDVFAVDAFDSADPDSSGSSGASSSEAGSSSSSSVAGGDSAPSTTDLLRQFADFCSLQGDSDDSAQPRVPQVAFSTMHAAKGKEYPCVVAMGLYEGLLPSSNCSHPEEYEQERNVAYVAATRAKEHLLLTWPRVLAFTNNRRPFGEPQKLQVSRFIADVLHQAQQGSLEGVEVLPGHQE